MPTVIDVKTKEGIIAEYTVINSINGVAKKFDVSWATARKIISESQNEINKIRNEKQTKYMNDAWEVVSIYLNKLMDPKTVKEAKARDCATIIIGMIERIQKQQELNQQYDVMYYNVKEYITEGLKGEMEGTPLREALDDFFNKQWEKDKGEMKKTIRKKIKANELSVIDSTKHKKDMDAVRKDLEYMYDQAKKEIIDDIFKENEMNVE